MTAAMIAMHRRLPARDGAAGALYGAFDRTVPGNPILEGAGFGLFVWTASYRGLLPAGPDVAS
jgi:hypothetical protein